ncbi:MAG: hypothetical protein V4479_07530 [Actinomycetota bacterium]
MSDEAPWSDDSPDATAAAQRMLENKQWPIIVKLGTPVEFGKETITELAFQKGNFGMLKGMSVDRVPTVDELQLIASRLCKQHLRVIESLDPDDASEVTGAALAFFNRCQGAGKRL